MNEPVQMCEGMRILKVQREGAFAQLQMAK